MSCLWVDCRDHPVLGDSTRYAPGPILFSRLDVLGGDEGEHPDGVLLLGGELFSCDDVEESALRARRPVDDGLADHRVVVSELESRNSRDRGYDPADGRDDLGDGVLGGDRVVEDRRVERPAVLLGQHAGGLYYSPHGLEDPVGRLGVAKAASPIGEVREIEARVVEGEPTGDLPVDAGPQRSDGVPVGETFEGLEHHHRTDDIDRDRGTSSAGGEQVREVLVFEQLVAVIGEEGADGALLDEAPAERGCVEHLAVWVRFPLHKPILVDGRGNREHPRRGV